MSPSRRLRAALEDLSGVQRVSEGSGATRSLSRDAGLRDHAKGRQRGWYWEVNDLTDIQTRVVPFFERFPLVGTKAKDFDRFKCAVELLAREVLTDSDYVDVLALREEMNGGGKRRYTMERILRDYTPSSATAEMR